MPAPPKHPSQRRRRNKDAAVDPILRLPAGGRVGPTPSWPLDGQSEDERVAWDEVWHSPQAAAWERTGVPCRVVARYVRLSIQAEQVGAKAALASEVRQMEDKLGLNPRAMMSLRWAVDDDEVADARSVRSEPRARLKVVAPDAVAGA